MNLIFDEQQLKEAVRTSLHAAIEAAPWPPTLAGVATAVLSEPARTLGGSLTPWALMPLCCCAATRGDWRPAIPAAAAAELYTTALDLFDDVEDGDRSPSIDRYGVPVVLNTATALLALAHTVLLPSAPHGSIGEVAHRRAADALWQGLAEATGGQHLDLAAAGADPLAVTECIDIARRKGGALTEAVACAGAAFGTDDPPLIDLFAAFGRSLGLLGQLDNDMHDADNGDAKTDLARRKQTVPVAVARVRCGEDDLGDAVWRGGIQLAYALVAAERARARDALEAAAAACPDPSFARSVLEPLLMPRGTTLVEMAL